MTFLKGPERRSEPRRPSNLKGVVTAPGLEVGCVITDESGNGLRIRLERRLALPDVVQVVDVAGGLAIEGRIAWRKGHEAGLRRLDQAPLRGLVSRKYAAARDAWLRAGGR